MMSSNFIKTYSFREPVLRDIDLINAEDKNDFPLLGGFFQSSVNYVWHAKGATIEIRNTTSGIKVGSWTFGNILRDPSTEIVAIAEIKKPSGRIPLLTVGVNNSQEGFICILDPIFTSKVIRVIQIQDKISSLHVVDSGCDDVNVSSFLKYFQGTIAVGTQGGNVYLLDLCRQACEDSLQTNQFVRDELCPCQMVALQKDKVSKIRKYIDRCIQNSEHLAVQLNSPSDNLEHFTLKGPKGDDRIHVNREEVEVSCLHFSKQLNSLLIGYNFGAFQIWDLQSFQLVYTSPVCDEHIPVTHFAVQEPSDDPKAYCYIWVAYSNSKLFEAGLPFAVMYSLYYEDRVLRPNHGYLYQNFQHCSIRFQIELGDLNNEKQLGNPQGGCCLCIKSIAKNLNTKVSLELCMITWSVWFSETETQTFLLLFDLNQWYKEQMPTLPNWDHFSNYMIKLNLNDKISHMPRKNEPILAVKIDKDSLHQYVGIQKLEEHFCPTSLSFDVWFLNESLVAKYHNEGKQKALLTSLVNIGPLCLLKPKDVLQEIISLGLTPLFSDVCTYDIPLEMQRELILNVALEQDLTGWLCKCASDWANGSFLSSGCTLTFLLNWAFQRACSLKNICEEFCRPLFDYSGSKLDENTNRLLYNCTRQINCLLNLYNYVLKKLSQFIPVYDHVNEQYHFIQNITTYYEVLLWLVNIGLLPECHPSTYPRPDEHDRVSAPYPAEQLVVYYDERRANLQQLCNDLFINDNSLLFIDNLVVYKCGAERLEKLWQEDGGSGLYPPPSVQSMLRTYLIENVNIKDTHLFVLYVFFDIAMALNKNRYGEVVKQLLKFSSVFHITLSMIKIIQGFWHLDHGDFEIALENIFDSNVAKEDLQHWHDMIVLRSFIAQNQMQYALKYLQIRKPVIIENKDIVVVLNILIANDMLDEAFNFIKQYPDNAYLGHFFNECNKNGKLSAMLYKYLEEPDEMAFLKYLQGNGNHKAEDLQVFYFLLRSRFPEALDIYDKYRRKMPDCQGLVGKRNASKTDHVLNIYKNYLPNLNKQLVRVVRNERMNLFNKVPEKKPFPLSVQSVHVHNIQDSIRYKSSVIYEALSTAKQTFDDSRNISNIGITEETPFLRTPKTIIENCKQRTPLINPTLIELDEKGDPLSPSPAKKIKLSPRLSTISPIKQNISSNYKMSTPVVRRRGEGRYSDGNASNVGLTVCTPQSILKVRNKNLDDIASLEDSTLEAKSPSKLLFDLSGRKPIGKASHVKFDDLRYSSSLSEHSKETSLNTTKTNKDTSDANSNESSKESFYSPEASLELKNNILVVEQPVIQEQEVEIETPSPTAVTTPRARRSYKRVHSESSSPLRSSPRLSKISTEISIDHETEENEEKAKNEDKPGTKPDESINSSPRQKMQARKSLSRMVLENNAFATLAKNIVSKETMYLKTETVKTLEISNDGRETTAEESTLETSTQIETDTNTSMKNYQHSISSSRNRKSLFEISSTDVSQELPINEFSDYSNPEYLEEDSFKQSFDDDKFDEPATGNEQIKSLLGENSFILADEDKNQSKEIEKSNVKDDLPELSDENKEDDEPMEINVYEDLSSGTEDIEEILKSEHKTEIENTQNEMVGELPKVLQDDQIIEIGSSESSESTSENSSSNSSSSSSSYSSSSGKNSGMEFHYEESPHTQQKDMTKTQENEPNDPIVLCDNDNLSTQVNYSECSSSQQNADLQEEEIILNDCINEENNIESEIVVFEDLDDVPILHLQQNISEEMEEKELDSGINIEQHSEDIQKEESETESEKFADPPKKISMEQLSNDEKILENRESDNIIVRTKQLLSTPEERIERTELVDDRHEEPHPREDVELKQVLIGTEVTIEQPESKHLSTPVVPNVLKESTVKAAELSKTENSSHAILSMSDKNDDTKSEENERDVEDRAESNLQDDKKHNVHGRSVSPFFQADVKKTYLPLMKVKTPKKTYSRKLTSSSELAQLEYKEQVISDVADEKNKFVDDVSVSPKDNQDIHVEHKKDDDSDEDTLQIPETPVLEVKEKRITYFPRMKVKTPKRTYPKLSEKPQSRDEEDVEAETEQELESTSKHQVEEVHDKGDKPSRRYATRHADKFDSGQTTEKSITNKEELEPINSESNPDIDKIEVSSSVSGRTSLSSSMSAPFSKRITRRSLLTGHDDSGHLEATASSTPTKTRRQRSSSKEVTLVKSPTKRTRSASVDEQPKVESTFTTRRKITRRTVSTDTTEQKKATRRGRAASVADLPIIEEVNKNDSSTSKRGTRKKIMLQLDPIDPIKLLDKSPFKGMPDPEEENVLKELSPSPTNRRTRKRSASVASDVSLPPSVSVQNSPKRERSTSRASSPILTGIRTRLRKASTDTAASEVSIPPHPKQKKKQEVKGEEGSESSVPALRMTRSRSNSVSSIASMKSDVSESSKKVDRRKAKTAIRELPEISEVGEPIEQTQTKVTTRSQRK